MPLKDITPEQGLTLLTNAETFENKPYLDDGGNESNPTDGFDCSGLVWYVIARVSRFEFEYRSTGYPPLLAMHPMLRKLKVPPEALRAGDIVLLHGHVGFYDPDPPKAGKTLYSATGHGVRHEYPKFWGHPLGYFRLQVLAP